MASVRARRRKGGVYWFLVDRYGHERAMGIGKQGESAAFRARGRLEVAEWAERRGEPPQDPVGPCAWSLQELSERDQASAIGRASADSRRRLWAVLLEGLGETTRLDQLTPARIQSWALRRARDRKPRTVNNGLSLLAAALKLARRMRHESGFTGNPMAEVTRIAVPTAEAPRARSEADVKTLLRAAWRRAAAAPAHLAQTWRDDAVALELLYFTSSRISQILRLRWDQIEGELVHFPPHKGGSPREFLLTTRLAKMLRKSPRRGAYVFPSSARARKPYRTDLKRCWTAIAPAGFTPHGLRHSRITAALYAGEAPGDVVNRGGWKDYQMLTRTYGHVWRRPIGDIPRAGQKTAGTAGRKRRGNAGEPAKSAHPASAAQARQARKPAASRPG